MQSKAEKQLVYVANNLGIESRLRLSRAGVPHLVFNYPNETTKYSIAYFAKNKHFVIFDNYGVFADKQGRKYVKDREQLIEYINSTYLMKSI